jgi:hypothetical protein
MKLPPKIRVALAAAAPCCAVLAASSNAATLQLGHMFSDTPVAPDASGPWLTVATTHLGSNQIHVDLSATALSDPEFVSEWFLNLDPVLDLDELTISALALSGGFNVPAASELLVGTDAYKADGDGLYDIKVIFATSDGLGTRFTAGDTLRLTLTYTGAGTLDASSLGFPSAPDGGSGPFLAAAHINSTGFDNEGSVWVAAVPEPSVAMSALLAGVVLLPLRHRRRRQDC